MKKLSKYISPLLLIGAAVIWGFAFTAQKAAVEVPPFMLGALRSAIASIILSTESVFGVLGSAWLLGERMNSREVVGCAILLFAVILAQVGIPQLFQKTRAKQKDEKEQ